MVEKQLGKIRSVSFGYNEYTFGLHLILGGANWGVSTSIHYNPTYKELEDSTVTETMWRIQALLKDAGVDTVDKLKDKPIEVVFDGNFLKDFRILTEVI